MNKGRTIMAGLFIAAGVLHFVLTPVYVRIMPAYLPAPIVLVQVSGVCEVLGGCGLLIPQTRRLAAWGLVALLIAVMPANVTMAVRHADWPNLPEWLLWARLPLQVPLIAWAWLYTRRQDSLLDAAVNRSGQTS
jgi:uncharacterized membrane protein